MEKFKLLDQHHSPHVVEKNQVKMSYQKMLKMISPKVLFLKLVRNSPNFSMHRRKMHRKMLDTLI